MGSSPEHVGHVLYEHVTHPHVHARREQGPALVADQLPAHSAFARFNSRVGLRITLGVGTMICAYVFTVLALISLPSAIRSHDVIVIISWVAQTFLQLVLLPIIIVGQNVQAQAADRRAQQTYDDAEAVLHTALELERHLQAQDAKLLELTAALAAVREKGEPA